MKSVELHQIVGGGDESARCVDEAFGLSLPLLQISRDLFIIPISNVLGVARVTLHQLKLGFKCCVTHTEWLQKLLVKNFGEAFTGDNLNDASHGCIAPERVGVLDARLGGQSLLGQNCGDIGLVAVADWRVGGETPHGATGEARCVGEALGDCG